MRRLKSTIPFLLLALAGFAQPVEQAVKVVVTPDAETWQRRAGEPVTFRIEAMRNGAPMRDATLVWQVGPERMSPMLIDSLILKDGRFTTPPYRMNQPGFLRCIATVRHGGRVYRGLATVGYDIERIQPTVVDPSDFDAFWERTRKELAALPIDARVLLLPERSTSTVRVFHVNLQGLGGSRLYGMLAVPVKPGPHPAILQVPGAGIRPYNPDIELAEKGVIVFTVGIHGIPVNMDPSVYRDLEAGALKGYFHFNNDSRDRYYYRRVYAGCVRAIDYIFSLSEFDGRSLGVSGNSQGGALSIVTAALDARVKCLASVHPALCDLTGYLQGRAGGWPHVLWDGNSAWYRKEPAVVETLSYYDVVNFAKRVRVPGFYTWGFNDETCPPTSMYAAYNVVRAPKETALFTETGHWAYPEQRAAMNDWLLGKLRSK
jgi:cephalosporin-C deacetylase-like acetyl esterase